MQHHDLPQDDYQLLLTLLIKKQMSVFGPEVALKIVSKVPSIMVDRSGNVVEIAGNASLSVTRLITQYQNLSKTSTQKSLEPILKKYAHLINENS